MVRSNYHRGGSAARTESPTLRVVKPASPVRLGGTLPTEGMEPGKYLVTCENAWLEPLRGKGQRAALQFRIVDGKHDGVALRMWIDGAVDGGGFVSPIGKYARVCQLALGRPLQDDDPIDQPGEFFTGRRFVVFVGYRKSERAGGGGRSSDDLALMNKDKRDYLRIHDVISREDLQ